MIELHFEVTSDQLTWTVTPIPSEASTTEDVICLSFGTAEFGGVSERRAFERIRSVLRREKADWVQPSLDGWHLNLDGISGYIQRPDIIPWLKGMLLAKPEFKIERHTTSGTVLVTAEFTFFITEDELAQSGQSDPIRNQVFISYSHRDKRWLDRLQVHLRPLEREGLIGLFDDTKIKPGARWREEIKAALDKAKVAVLLISADFLASDFIARDELPPLLKKAQNGGATILPLIVSACRFHREKSLAEYQAVNDPSKPLASLTSAESEHVLAHVAEAVEEALQTNRKNFRDKDGSPEPVEKIRAEPVSGSAKELLDLMKEEEDLNLKGLTEIRDSPEPGQTMFLASLATHGAKTVYKMKSRLFREGVEELVKGKWLYPPESTSGALLYEFRTKDHPPFAQKVFERSDPSTTVPAAIPVPNRPSLVESPFQPGKYFNVSDFASGDRVRDPYTGKVCIVP